MKTMLFVLSMLALISCQEGSRKSGNPQFNGIDVNKLKTDSNGLSTTSAVITTVHGNIVFRFYTKTAPQTSARIIQLIQSKFYDGMVIHRMIPNFILQAGDPTGTGTGGSGMKLKPEFSDLQHIKGTIGLAHGFDPNTGDSQFYICLTTLPHLDKKYTVFGQVVEGFDVLSKLSKGDKILSISMELKE